MAKKKDDFSILGLKPNATDEAIKKAYRRLALQFHPDKNPGDSSAERRFREITAAYESLRQKTSGPQRFGHTGFKSPPRSTSTTTTGKPLPDLEDIFQAHEHSSQENVLDLRYNLNLSFEEAALGCEKSISFVRHRGTGDETTRLSITIPAGVRPGQRLKIRGEGDQKTGSNQKGDLYVVIAYQEHPLFTKHDDDVLMNLPISFVDALLGSHIEIPTLLGKAHLDIPSMTPSGQTFRLKGKGFPRANGPGFGDMLVKIIIDTPKELTPEEINLVERLRSSAQKAPLVHEFREKFRKLRQTRS